MEHAQHVSPIGPRTIGAILGSSVNVDGHIMSHAFLLVVRALINQALISPNMGTPMTMVVGGEVAPPANQLHDKADIPEMGGSLPA